MATQGKINNETIDQFNTLFREALSDVETYRLALEKIDDPSLAMELREALSSHQERANLLKGHILAMGGEPATSSGAWGTLSKLVQGGANVFGDKVAIAALEEGEDRRLKEYQQERDKLDPQVRAFVEQNLLTGQQKTHRILSTLKHRLASQA